MRLADVLSNLPAKYLVRLAGRLDESRSSRSEMAAEARERLLAPGAARETFDRLRPESRTMLKAALGKPDFCTKAMLLAGLDVAGYSERFHDTALNELKRVGFVYEMASGGERGVFLPDDLVVTLVRVFPDLYESRVGEWETRYALLPPLLGYAADLRIAGADAAGKRLAERLRIAGRDAAFVAERVRALVAKAFDGADLAADLELAGDLGARLSADDIPLPAALRRILSGEAETLDLGVMKEPAPDAVETALFLWNAGFLSARAFDRRLPVVVRRAPSEADAAPFAADPAQPARLHVAARPPFQALHLVELLARPVAVPGVPTYEYDAKRAKAAFAAGLPADALARLPAPFAQVASAHAPKRRRTPKAAPPPESVAAETAAPADA